MPRFTPICLALLITLLLPLSAIGQSKVTDWWIFGRFVQHTFNPEERVYYPIVNHTEGTASVANPCSGEPMFWSDGVDVYDSRGIFPIRINPITVPFPLGKPLEGHPSSTQSALIVPYTGRSSDPNKYLLVTMGETFGTDRADLSGISFYEIDAGTTPATVTIITENLLNGSGGPDEPAVSEKLCGVETNDGNYWIVARDESNSNFYAFEFAGGTLNTTPVISSAGTPATDLDVTISDPRFGPIGYLNANCAGDQLAMVNYTSKKVQIFDLDQTSGSISHNASIPFTPPIHDVLEGPRTYGIEFSRGGGKLFFSTIHDVYQITAPWTSATSSFLSDPADRRADLDEGFGALQISPDGNKIYVAKNMSNRLAEITNITTTPTFEFNGRLVPSAPPFTTPARSKLGLPNHSDQFQCVCRTPQVELLPSYDLCFCDDVPLIIDNIQSCFTHAGVGGEWLIDIVERTGGCTSGSVLYMDNTPWISGQLPDEIDLTDYFPVGPGGIDCDKEYFIQIQVRNDCGHSVATSCLTTKCAPKPLVMLPTDVDICPGECTEWTVYGVKNCFTGTTGPIPSGSSIEWRPWPINPTVLGTGTRYTTCRPTDPHGYWINNVAAVISYPWGCDTNSCRLRVNKIMPPTITTTESCSGCSYHYSMSISGEGPMDWDISPGGLSGTIGASTSLMLPPLAPGTYTITVIDKYGCESEKELVISPPPVPPIADAGLDISVCRSDMIGGYSIGIGSLGLPGHTYTWDLGGSAVVLDDPSTANPNMTIPEGHAPGTWTISLTVTDPCGCVSMDDFTISVNENPEFTPATCVEVICEGGSVLLNPVPSMFPTVGPYTFSWSTGATTSTTSVTPSSTTTFWVDVTNANNCTGRKYFEVIVLTDDWQKQIASPDGGNVQVNAVKSDDQGNIYIAGALGSWDASDPDQFLPEGINSAIARSSFEVPFIAKYKVDCGLEWVNYPLDGSEGCIGLVSDLHTDPNGDCYAVGTYIGQMDIQNNASKFGPVGGSHTTTYNATVGSMFVWALDKDGSTRWLTYSSNASYLGLGHLDAGYMKGKGIVNDINNGILVTGTIEHDHGLFNASTGTLLLGTVNRSAHVVNLNSATGAYIDFIHTISPSSHQEGFDIDSDGSKAYVWGRTNSTNMGQVWEVSLPLGGGVIDYASSGDNSCMVIPTHLELTSNSEVVVSGMIENCAPNIHVTSGAGTNSFPWAGSLIGMRHFVIRDIGANPPDFVIQEEGINAPSTDLWHRNGLDVYGSSDEVAFTYVTSTAGFLDEIHQEGYNSTGTLIFDNQTSFTGKASTTACHIIEGFSGSDDILHFCGMMDDEINFPIPITDLGTTDGYVARTNTTTEMHFRDRPVESAKRSLVKVFPNPTSAGTLLVWEGLKFDKLDLFSSDGRLLVSQEIDSSKKQYLLSLDNFPEGIYQIRLSGPDSRDIRVVKSNQ